MTATVAAGAYFAPGGSARVRAVLRAGADGVRIEAESGAVLAGPLAAAALQVSPRVGNTPRFVRFPDGGAFETADNAAIDALLAPLRPRHGLVHRLESRLRYALIGVAVTAVLAWGAVRHGIPALAEAAARALPPSVTARLGEGVLEVLDSRLLGPSTLAEAEQARLRARFEPFTRGAGGGVPVRIEFRDAERTLGPNALALPSGTIVFTDQLVRRAAGDDELIGVLVHEIGHIEHRHALRHAIQGSTLGLVATVLTGDVSSIPSVIAAIPVILTELGYSRDFEFEADRHAARVLRQHGLPPEALGRMLAALERDHGDAACALAEDAAPRGCHGEDWWRYLSTHPPVSERIRRLGEAGG
ncbi:M48 family metallopeptidase [Thauera sinica]|uniref:M48 family metallopeptidase n=1 Tax=Thauera sinica TaxID=2665146 RepID=A0ABW1APF3_9RHOO|nr:M48 family metallopeptidase [Thauera sp. K11]ATE62308.1 peptidase M48 Ste24p [Thauera sp. K11]